ncbi:MAG: hypothetical protein GX384_02010 [Clostridiaceae bacterium]|jgi:uridine kinase|nr:hypothetical protein [Clostridiaceae bacterium]
MQRVQNNVDLRSIMMMHAGLYPEMQIQDMVKLIFQNEFAGGHFISNEQKSLYRLLDEYEAVRQAGKRPGAGSFFTDIGNGLCRLDISVLGDTDINPSTVNRFFINTAKEVEGRMESFEEKLDVLRQCCINGDLKYSLEELEAYLDDYRREGYPPVSHSEIYRDAYSPAYRIVKSDYRKHLKIFLAIDSLMRSKKNVVVAIDGNSGAGKSTLAALIADVYDCNLFHMDDFFLRPEQRTEDRFKETGGFVDYERFYQEVIQGLKSRKPFSYRVFDCRRMALGEVVRVEPKQLSIIEGSYSMHPTLAVSYDLKIFVHVNAMEQERRILKRNGKEMLKRFLNEWIPRENRYFEEMGIREQCHLVFENC